MRGCEHHHHLNARGGRGASSIPKGVDGIAWVNSGFYPHVVLLMRHCNVLGTLVRGRRLRATCWAWLGGHGSIPLLQGYGRTRSLGRALSDPRSGLPTVGFSQGRMLLFSLNAQGRRDRTTERSKAKATGWHTTWPNEGMASHGTIPTISFRDAISQWLSVGNASC